MFEEFFEDLNGSGFKQGKLLEVLNFSLDEVIVVHFDYLVI
jgi:hypothetical protein